MAFAYVISGRSPDSAMTRSSRRLSASTSTSSLTSHLAFAAWNVRCRSQLGTCSPCSVVHDLTFDSSGVAPLAGGIGTATVLYLALEPVGCAAYQPPSAGRSTYFLPLHSSFEALLHSSTISRRSSPLGGQLYSSDAVNDSSPLRRHNKHRCPDVMRFLSLHWTAEPVAAYLHRDVYVGRWAGRPQGLGPRVLGLE